MTQKGFPSPTSVRRRNPYPVLPQQDTERLSLSWLGTTEKGFPHAISRRHRKASLAMIQLSWRGPEELPGMALPLTLTKRPGGDWGCYPGFQLSPQDTNTLLEMNGNIPGELTGMDLPTTWTKLLD